MPAPTMTIRGSRLPALAVISEPYACRNHCGKSSLALDLRCVAVVIVAQQFFGVLVGIGAGLAVVEVGWWNPFGVAGFQLAGAPGAAGDEFVVWAAALGQVVHVCGPALGVVGHVVHFGEVAGHIAIGKRTATVLGVE